MMSDLDMLLDMGFEKDKAEIAIKKGGNRMTALYSRHKIMCRLPLNQCRAR